MVQLPTIINIKNKKTSSIRSDIWTTKITRKMNKKLIEYWTEQLDALNEQFSELLNDFRTLLPEQQTDEEVKRSFYQGQADFHFAAHKCILVLCELAESIDDQVSADIPPGQGEPLAAINNEMDQSDGERAGDDSEQNESPTVDPNNPGPPAEPLAGPSALVQDQDAKKDGTEPPNEPLTPMDESDEKLAAATNVPIDLHALAYKNYRFCLEPILQLQPINRVSETALETIIRALNEAVRRASDFNACIDSETRAILAMMHRLLDRTTQILVYAMARQVESTGQMVTLNMLADVLVDRSQNILPEELQVDRFSRDMSRDPSPAPSTSGASATKKPKVAVCPNCGGDHYLHRCEPFRLLTYTQRMSVIVLQCMHPPAQPK